jgi:isopentenyl-diphosphate Delta-isomerase
MQKTIEHVQYCDANGTPSGETEEKYAAHHANTKMHLGFSCYVFNDKGEFLVTQRASTKKVWPNVWTNTVCGHVSVGETFEDAIVRRSDYELGMKVKNIKCINSDYTYITTPYNGIVDHEFCPIHIADIDGDVVPNPDEVMDYKWVKFDDFINDIKSDKTDVWSWWCKDQAQHTTVSPDVAERISRKA